jgi:circadian clock protein KaiB
MQEEKCKLILFISGMSVKSVHALENLKRITEGFSRDRFELEIIDVSKNMEKAVTHQIVALPTLIKYNPSPRRTIVGDLSDKEKVLKILDIK